MHPDPMRPRSPNLFVPFRHATLSVFLLLLPITLVRIYTIQVANDATGEVTYILNGEICILHAKKMLTSAKIDHD